MEQAEQVSNVTPVAVIALLVMMGLTWSLPRRFAVCPLLAMTCLMPLGQELDIFGLHFHLFRILLLVGVARCIAKGEASQLTWSTADKFFLWWVVVSVAFGTMAKPSMQLFVNRAGDMYNAVGCYFFIRCVIVELEDVAISVRTLALLCVPLAGLMLVEKVTTHNPFSVFGGVPPYSFIRNGHVRCQGAFRHAILAGTFGATQLPLFAGLWYYRREYRKTAIIGMVAAAFIVVAASSSGALMAMMAGGGGIVLWKWKQHTRWVRRGAVGLLVVLALVMNAPVWYIFAKLSSVAGGEGWHRAWLIDQAVHHFDEWWLFGTTYTAHWGPAGEVIATDPDNMDITNHYVMEGVKGGLLKLILFVGIIVCCFKAVGRRARAEEPDSPAAFFIWTVGVSLCAHALSLMSVPYFDQIIVIWYWVLAVASRADMIPDESMETVIVTEEGPVVEAEESTPSEHSSWEFQNE